MTSDSFGHLPPTSNTFRKGGTSRIRYHHHIFRSTKGVKVWGILRPRGIHLHRVTTAISNDPTWIFIESEIPENRWEHLKGPQHKFRIMSLFGGKAKTKELNRIIRNKYLKRPWRVSVENHVNNEEKRMEKYSNHPLWDSRFFSPVHDSSAFFHKWYSVFFCRSLKFTLESVWLNAQ